MFSKYASIEWFQIDTIPFFFTTTMPTHQGVGCCTFDIIPWASITSNSCFTLSRRGNGMFLAVLSEKGQASGLTRISYCIAGNFDGGKFWRMLTFQIFDGKYFDGWSVSFTKHCIAFKIWWVKFWRSGWKASKPSKFPPVKISRYTVITLECSQPCICINLKTLVW